MIQTHQDATKVSQRYDNCCSFPQPKAAESVVEAFMELKANILIQEFIKKTGGADSRCLAIGDKVAAAMKGQGAEGEFRSNQHRGGTATLTKLSAKERATAIYAARTMGLNVAGVDLLRSARRPVVMEVNSLPGLEGIETATSQDIASMQIEFIEKHLENNVNRATLTKTRGKG